MRFFSALFICIIAFLTLWGFIPTEEECGIYDSTVRLHILANSDSEEDQRVKLLVRDAVVEHISAYDAKSKEEALLCITADQDAICETAINVLRENGINDSVSIKIGEEQYPIRYYEDFSLPAGEYTSVQIIIGEGNGQNWWCVLFPPMCTSYAIEPDGEEYISAGLSRDQYNLITGAGGEYKVKFKLLEIAQEAFGA
ncbi:MAG: stage II sporulation protein R [Clostridia bacterium]|nr:stage II sporulation protein R [Clostridia bacterium]